VTNLVGASFLDPSHLISTFGLVGLLVMVFAECGLLVGFFLPGDSLLFIAGLLVSQGRLGTPIGLLCLLISVAAIAGNIVGYQIGRTAGPAVFKTEGSRFFRQEYVGRTEAFFTRYGGRSILLARFVPIVRTVITVMAGVGRMDRRTFVTYSIVGGILWGTSVTLLGYWLGNVAFVADHIELILVGVVLVSVIPIGVELLRGRRRQPAKEQ
jgi:membrane-associated protein